MGLFEKFGLGSNKVEKTEEETAPEMTVEEMEAYARKQGFSGTPANFNSQKDLNQDPNIIEWQDPETLPDVDQGVNQLQGNRDESMFKRVNRE